MKKLLTWLSFVVLLATVIGSGAYGQKGKGGGRGGKPPKGPANPVLLVGAFGGGLVAVDVNGENRLRVVRDGAGQPSWSPDGRFVAVRATASLFGVSCPPPANIGVGLVELLDPVAGDWSGVEILFCLDGSGPAFSPVASGDTYQIAFSGRISTETGSTPNELRVVEVVALPGGGFAVSESVNLSNTPAINEGGPTWSPDGTEIAVAAVDLSNGERDLVAYPANGLGLPQSLIQGRV